jgi:polar amino acid transport system substrate-binding protein
MLIHKRVDYAFGDNTAIKQTTIGKDNKNKLQFSKSSLLEAQVGFFYNTLCELKLFTEDGLKNK